MGLSSRSVLILATAVIVAGVAVVGLLATGAGTGAPAVPLDSVDAVLEEAGRIDGLRALLVQRDGQTVLEGYFDGAGPDDLHHLRSATKSVISLLVGIALDRGDLESVDQTLGELLGKRVERFGPKKAALTVAHFLTMSAGLEWDESTVDEFNRWVTSRDPVGHYLERPFVARPGERWAYSSGASHVLSAVLSTATGMPASEYARRHLFEPLGIDRFRWRKLADGHTNGAADLELRPRDTAKLGQLVLDEGSWSGRRVVSRGWIEAAMRPRFEVGGGTHYGYQWWIESHETARLWMAQGHAGQTLAIVPGHRLVIVANSRWRSLRRSSADQSREIGHFLGKRLAPFFVPELAEMR